MKLNNISNRLKKAVSFYWETREQQQKKQLSSGTKDQGARSAVTGGAQMDGFIQLLTEVIVESGINSKYIFNNHSLQLPGYFRPTKEWDLLVIKDGQLLIAIEAKSQIGPSFGNNFNNRTEEAMGSSLDLWTAYREGAFNYSIKPWIGYFFMLEDCHSSNTPVKVQEPHFKVFPEFINASYAKRYEIFCRKLVRERHYSASSFILSSKEAGIKGEYIEPSTDISFDNFVRSLIGQATAFGESISE
jgi:hypothetical protein